MTLEYLKNYFENTEHPKFFLTDVFSWRGIYTEVAFTPSLTGTKEESLECIEMALNETFEGYKGGEYTYSLYTNVHFEFCDACFNDNALFDLLLNEK